MREGLKNRFQVSGSSIADCGLLIADEAFYVLCSTFYVSGSRRRIKRRTSPSRITHYAFLLGCFILIAWPHHWGALASDYSSNAAPPGGASATQSGRTITYTYDSAGRLIMVDYGDGTGIRYTYDNAGNLLTRVVGALPAVITSISPANGPVGATVVIIGANLGGATAVTFNTTGAEIISKTATQIVTKVPAGATAGPIKITTPAGTTTSSINFTVTQRGDLNLDGVINVQDLIRLIQVLQGIAPATAEADVNADGNVNVADLISLYQKLLGNPLGN